MDNDDVQDKVTFTRFMKIIKDKNINIAGGRKAMSREITFKNEGSKYKEMYKNSKDGSERSTVIILDIKNAEVRTLDDEKGPKGADAASTFSTGTKFGNAIVLGNVHTARKKYI